MSYAVAERERGRGYAGEALAAACTWVAGSFGLRSILAITAAANRPSRRVLAGASFTHVRDESMLFQGSEQIVSRYRWRVPRAGRHA